MNAFIKSTRQRLYIPILALGRYIVSSTPYGCMHPDKGRREDIELACLEFLRYLHLQICAFRQLLLGQAARQPLSTDVLTELDHKLLTDGIKRHASLGRIFKRTSLYAVKDNSLCSLFSMPHLFLLLLFGLTSISHAQGLLLAKQRAWDNDSQATPLEYSSAEKFSTVYNIVTPLGQSKRISSGLIVKDISYRNLMVPENFQSSADKNDFQETIVDVQNTIAKWPASKSYLQPFVTMAQEATDKLSKGFIRVSGQWISREDHSKKQDDARKSAELDEQKYLQEQLEKRKARLASERALLNQQAKNLEESITAQETTLTELTRSANAPSTSPIPRGVEKKTFFLQRKLPKTSFESLYQLGQYVLECATSGENQCILVTNSISSLENRYVAVWIKRSFDIDVTLKSGSEERATVFVECDIDQISVLEASEARHEEAQSSLKRAAEVSENIRNQRSELAAVRERLASMPPDEGATTAADAPR